MALVCLALGAIPILVNIGYFSIYHLFGKPCTHVRFKAIFILLNLMFSHIIKIYGLTTFVAVNPDAWPSSWVYEADVHEDVQTYERVIAFNGFCLKDGDPDKYPTVYFQDDQYYDPLGRLRLPYNFSNVSFALQPWTPSSDIASA